MPISNPREKENPVAHSPYKDEIITDAVVLGREVIDFMKKFGTTHYGGDVTFRFRSDGQVEVLIDNRHDKYTVPAGKVKL